jgi:2-iminoacetate synthase
MGNIIDFSLIERLYSSHRKSDKKLIKDIIYKGKDLLRLSIEEVSILLSMEDEEIIALLEESARDVKERIFGKRIVLFAPLYLSNVCINNCIYCGFRRDNTLAERKTLDKYGALKEAEILENKGFKRILLVCGESPNITNVDYLIDIINYIYENTGIRILHLNAAPMSLEEMKRLKKSGVGVYQLFQETYHKDTYKKMHPVGLKSDYNKRINAMDVAIEAGFGDVGIGALLGLYDYKYDVLATIAHAYHLIDKYNTPPHTISVPRLQPALGSLLNRAPYPVSDKDFLKIIAVYRLALPTSGIVVTTRERKDIRDRVINMGTSQISAGSRTDPGGYEKEEYKNKSEQFTIEDRRSLDEVIKDIAELGFLPSLCTTCYRVGRTGSNFSSKAYNGMERFCLPNAILTLKEYELDYAKNGLKEICKSVIDKYINEISDYKLKKIVKLKLKEIESGKRDLYL